jgi:hypothetical protein
MAVKVMREQEVLREAVDVLWKHLSPAKVVRLWASWQIGEGDYLTLRDQLFAGESVATLFEKVQAYQEQGSGEIRVQG